MSTVRIVYLLFISVCFCAFAAQADEQPSASFPHINVEIVSEGGTDSSLPKLGVLFLIEPG